MPMGPSSCIKVTDAFSSRWLVLMHALDDSCLAYCSVKEQLTDVCRGFDDNSVFYVASTAGSIFSFRRLEGLHYKFTSVIHLTETVDRGNGGCGKVGPWPQCGLGVDLRLLPSEQCCSFD